MGGSFSEMNSDAQSSRLLFALIAAHFLVDVVASIINPLWPTLQRQTGSGDGEFLWLFVAWNVATSASQIGFAVVGDRFRGHWLLWIGPAVAICCISALGLTRSLPVLCLLVSCAGLGIAAFHPEAALLAGNCLPGRRSRAISLFQLGGFLGQTVGPIYSGFVVDRWGTPGLLPAVGWTLMIIAAARFLIRNGSEPVETSYIAVSHAPSGERGQWLGLAMLLVIGVLRIIPAAGVPMALAFLESARNSSTADIGVVQAAFTLGIGGGGLLCGLYLQQHQERSILWLLPLIAAPILWLIPATSGFLLLLACIAGGLLIGSTMPILISFGQQLLPRSPRVGSSITMGLSWGLGGGFAALIVMTLKPRGDIEQAFPLFAGLALLSSVCCLWLPHPPVLYDAGKPAQLVDPV